MPTELLVLSLIFYARASSLYALQQETALSAGALVPALRKLKAKGLLHAGLLGPRRRQEFSVKVGIPEMALEENWKSVAGRFIDDSDAVLKLCKVAEHFNLPLAVEYAKAAAEFRGAELRKYTNREGHIQAPELNVYSFRSYKEVARFHQLQAEEVTLRVVEAALTAEL